jgi:hypothetical protein
VKFKDKIMSKIQVIATVAAVSSALILVACGGGAGTPAPAPAAPTAPAPPTLGVPTVAGTVTGFGSIIIDGVRIDDRGIIALLEDAKGVLGNVELKMGQSVDIEHDGTLKAKRVLVNPEMQGVISAVDAAAGTMKVLGMTVVINTVR